MICHISQLLISRVVRLVKFESILNTSGIYALLWDLNSPRDCASLGKFRPEKEKVSLPGAVASCAS